MSTTELVFLVEESDEGGYTARAIGQSIFTEADNLASLRHAVRDAVDCHYDNTVDRPPVIRLHIVRDEVLT